MRLQTVSVGEFGKLSYVGTQEPAYKSYLHYFIVMINLEVWAKTCDAWYEKFTPVVHCYHPEDHDHHRMILSMAAKKKIKHPEHYMRSVARKLLRFIKSALVEAAERKAEREKC